MSRDAILVVDDDVVTRQALAARLRADGRVVLEATSARALDQLARGVDLVLLDDRVPAGEVASTLGQIERFDPDIRVILMSGCSGADARRPRLGLGIHEIVIKPFSVDDAAAAVGRALETARLRRAVRRLRAEAALRYGLQRLVGSSPKIVALRHLVARVAVGPALPILLTGEPGTGRNLVARIVHHTGERADQPFVSLNCAALSGGQIESALFGEERAPSDGPAAPVQGVIEEACGGTLLLHAVGELSSEPTRQLQAHLLRVLAEARFNQASDNTDARVDVRLIVASSRADLFVRPNAAPISIPALRSHAEDVPLLVEYFVEIFNGQLGKRILGATSAAYTLLEGYGWPGNVRELRNLVERAMLLSTGDQLDARDFWAIAKLHAGSVQFELPPGGVNLEQLERTLLVQALQRCGGNQTRAAGLLGMNRDQIRYRIEKFGLTAPR